MDDNNKNSTNSGTIEIKKELSDEDGTIPYEFETDEDCITSSDGIFEVIPFMAKLLFNLKCSFYSRNNEIVIASIELMSVQELIERLMRNKITPNRMDCGIDSTFTLFICDDQFSRISQFTNENSTIIRYLSHMAIVTECTNLSLEIENGEILICSISYDNLASLMIRLKEYDIRPRRVDSLRNSSFSLVFNEQSFSSNNSSNVLKFYQTNDSINLAQHDPLNIRRPRICPTYLRDYVIEHNKDEPVSGLDLIPFNPAARSSLSSMRANLSSMRANLSSMRSSSNFKSQQIVNDSASVDLTDNNNSLTVVKRGRGRPRIKPLPAQLSFDSNQTKRPRGRPRRSDIVPNIVASRANSFINIQPKSLTVQDIESCFVKFFETENLCASQK